MRHVYSNERSIPPPPVGRGRYIGFIFVHVSSFRDPKEFNQKTYARYWMKHNQYEITTAVSIHSQVYSEKKNKRYEFHGKMKHSKTSLKNYSYFITISLLRPDINRPDFQLYSIFFSFWQGDHPTFKDQFSSERIVVFLSRFYGQLHGELLEFKFAFELYCQELVKIRCPG